VCIPARRIIIITTRGRIVGRARVYPPRHKVESAEYVSDERVDGNMYETTVSSSTKNNIFVVNICACRTFVGRRRLGPEGHRQTNIYIYICIRIVLVSGGGLRKSKGPKRGVEHKFVRVRVTLFTPINRPKPVGLSRKPDFSKMYVRNNDVIDFRLLSFVISPRRIVTKYRARLLQNQHGCVCAR